MLTRRLPHPALRPFVEVLWATDTLDAPQTPAPSRERVLPTGAMHVVFRLSPEPLRLFEDEEHPVGRVVGHAIVGGARATAYVREVGTPVHSVGAMLRPGAARLLFGGSAAELAGKHTRLDELWGRVAEDVRERLVEAGSVARQLELFEGLLLERLPRVRGLHPAVAEALSKLGAGCAVQRAAAESGYSHRRFIALFEDAVGLTPKRYARVVRLRSVIERLNAAPHSPLAQVALAAGYTDQAHMNRDFREIAAISPTRYCAARAADAMHVPIAR